MGADALENVYQLVGKNILYLRKLRKMTQQQLSDAVNYTQSQISQYEKGKKSLSLSCVNAFADFFGVSLHDILFVDFEQKERCTRNSNNKQNIGIDDDSAPIHKCSNRTYFCYYSSDSTTPPKLRKAEIKVSAAKTPYSAEVQLTLYKTSYKMVINGTLIMDESYAYIQAREPRKDFLFELIFFYYRQSSYPYYKGGAALIQQIDDHSLPICQYGVLSVNEIAERKHNSVVELLRVDSNKTETSSKCQFSSHLILRLTKNKDKSIYTWLKDNVGL